MTIQHITYGAGGTITFNPRTALTSPTITIRTNKNSDIVTAQSMTASTVSTTLSSAASAGDTTIAVASATGFTNGIIISIAGDPEECIVESVSGTTITLRRPLILDHASASAVKCHTLTYSVSAADADTLFFNGRAIIYNNTAYYAQIPVECTRYPLFRLATINDIWDEHPQLRDILSPNDDASRLLDKAHNDVMSHIEATAHARCFFASGEEIARAVTFQFLANYYRHQASDTGSALYERYTAECAEEIKRVVAGLPRDTNQDQISTEAERLRYSSVRVIRS